MPSTVEYVSGNPLRGDTRLKVSETDRGSIALRPGLILEWAGEGRGDEETFLADILTDRDFDVPASQLVRGVVVGSHPVSSFVEMKWTFAQEEESQCTVQGGNVRQRPSPACRRGISGRGDSVTGASGAPWRC